MDGTTGKTGQKNTKSRSDVAAVIVTYNRVRKLEKVLTCLLGQELDLDAIYVVDNASTDETSKVVGDLMKDASNISYIRLEENRGGAGGFHEGIKAAYQGGHEYIWISDDDAYPEPGALLQLKMALVEFEGRTDRRPSFACSRVEWTDGSICEMNIPSPVWDWARFVDSGGVRPIVDSCSFVSVMVQRSAVKEHGLPISDYFIWYDDCEFTKRLSKSHPGIFVPESRVVHDIPENKGVNFSLIDSKNVWKYEYGARNQMSYSRREFGTPGAIDFAFRVNAQMKSGMVPFKLRWKIFSALVRGYTFRPEIARVNE